MFQEFIKKFRDKFDEIFLSKAKTIAEDSEIRAVRRRIKKKKQITKDFDYESSDDADHRNAVEKFEHEFVYTLMYVVTTSLVDRFELLKNHVDLWNYLNDLKNASENENELFKP